MMNTANECVFQRIWHGHPFVGRLHSLEENRATVHRLKIVKGAGLFLHDKSKKMILLSMILSHRRALAFREILRLSLKTTP